jgi:hypothetical protein
LSHLFNRFADLLLERLAPRMAVTAAALPSGCTSIIGQSCNAGACRQCVWTSIVNANICGGRNGLWCRTYTRPPGGKGQCSRWTFARC